MQKEYKAYSHKNVFILEVCNHVWADEDKTIICTFVCISFKMCNITNNFTLNKRETNYLLNSEHLLTII